MILEAVRFLNRFFLAIQTWIPWPYRVSFQANLNFYHVLIRVTYLCSKISSYMPSPSERRDFIFMKYYDFEYTYWLHWKSQIWFFYLHDRSFGYYSVIDSRRFSKNLRRTTNSPLAISIRIFEKYTLRSRFRLIQITGMCRAMAFCKSTQKLNQLWFNWKLLLENHYFYLWNSRHSVLYKINCWLISWLHQQTKLWSTLHIVEASPRAIDL